MTHTHVGDHPRTAEGSARQLRALRLMIVVLIPVAVWTVVGLIWLWPDDVSQHIRQDTSTFSVQGLTLPRGEITQVTPISCGGQVGSTPGEQGTGCAELTVKLLEGPETGQEIKVNLTEAQFASGVEPGQKVKLFRVPAGGQASYQFSDFDRTIPLIALTALFALAVVAVARWRGFASLIGLAFAGFILTKFMFPAMVAGENPLLVGLIGSSAIMFVVLYTAHGFSARTTTALIGTLFGLLLTAGLGWAFTEWAHLTGVGTEDDYLLAASAPDMKLTSVVLCGVIVAGLGVLNDVTITQASAVWELAESDPDQKQIFSRAMRIGRDHVASSVYTIAFATAGAALAAMLLIVVYSRPMLEVAQTEALSQEIVRTLVGAIGLVLSMPLTTAVGVAVVKAGKLGRSHSAKRDTRSEDAAASTDAESTEPGEAGEGTLVGTAELPRTGVRPSAATTAPLDDRETTRLPRIRRTDEPGRTTPAEAAKETRVSDPVSRPTEGRRRSRRARDDDEDFNFADLRGDDDGDEQPRGRRWR